MSASLVEPGGTVLAAARPAALSLPMPPNVSHVLESGLRDRGRWRIPLLVRLPDGLTVPKVAAVLTAVVNHHDALRLQIVEHSGGWEHRIGEREEFADPTVRAVDPDEPAAVAAVVADLLDDGDDASALSAAVLVDPAGAPRMLALGVHHLAADASALEIIVSDVCRALYQQHTGRPIALPPLSASWAECAQRWAALASHPSVLEEHDWWQDSAAQVTLRPVDHVVGEPPYSDDVACLPVTLGPVLTAEVDDTERNLAMSTEEVLLAAFGRALARTLGDGVVAVDIVGDARAALAADIDVHRTVGCLATLYPVALHCAGGATESAADLLAAVRGTLRGVPHHGIGYGVLRHLYAPTARRLADQPAADIVFSYTGAVPVPLTAAAPTLENPAMAVRQALPGLGHAIEVRAYRLAGSLHLDWWYDTRRLDRVTVEELTDQFPLALIELTSEALGPVSAFELECAGA